MSRKERKEKEKKEKTKLTFREVLRKIVFCISLCVFLFSAYKLFWIVHDYIENKVYYDEVRELAPKETEEDGVKKYLFSSEDFDDLYSRNSDFRGWITIPNTKVNYPMVQGRNNDFYLKAGLDKYEVNGGSIFIAHDNPDPFNDQNTIIHGHHMKNGSMFGSLRKYKKKEFFDNNPIVYISLRDKCLRYEIFSVYICDITKVVDTKTSPYMYSISNDDDYVNYLKSLKKKSLFQRKDFTDFNKDDKIITLSTCSYEYENARMLIHARLIDDEDTSDANKDNTTEGKDITEPEE